MLYTDPFLDDGLPATKDDDIIKEALDRWQASEEWQGVEDQRSREDIKFANGDPRNLWQWPQASFDLRDGQDLPCLTINNTRVHNDLIINSITKNGYGVTVRPTGGKASYKSAQAMEMLIRRTQNISKATTQFRKVVEQQVDGGIGYIMIETEYVSERSFDQDIFLKASRDPTAVRLDPWITEIDGSDANFGFVLQRLSRKEFNLKYPKYKDNVGATPLDNSYPQGWLTDKEIMLCKYYRRSERPDTLVSYEGEDSEEHTMLSSEIKDDAGKEIYKALMKQIKDGVIKGQTRKVGNPKVEWFLIAGAKIIDKGEWAGKYIPICRCVGRELVIDNTLDRKGHTRPLINAQHMLNYMASVSVQDAASATKSQWLAPARATEGQEQWKTANTDNFAVMLYNDIDDEASPEMQNIPPPQRIEPRPASPAAQAGMQNAERQMMMISGQFEAQMGENDTQSAASGKAIGERKQQGETATYHFPEHFSDMLRFIGVQLLDLYPKIYDTKRALHDLGEDGEKRWIQIDPSQDEAVIELKDERELKEALQISFNPSLGEYEVVSDPGPDSATQRQQGWDALSMILQNNKELAATCADLLFKFGDFPGADELMDRLQKEIKQTKPYLFDNAAPTPALQQAQLENQKLTALNAELMQKLASKELALRGRDERRDIEASRAETDRLKVQLDYLTKVMLSPADKARMEHEIESKFHDASLNMIVQTNAAELQQQASGNPDQTSPNAPGGGSDVSAGNQPQMQSQGPSAAPQGPSGALGLPPQFEPPRVAPDGNTYVRHSGTGVYHRVDRIG